MDNTTRRNTREGEILSLEEVIGIAERVDKWGSNNCCFENIHELFGYVGDKKDISINVRYFYFSSEYSITVIKGQEKIVEYSTSWPFSKISKIFKRAKNDYKERKRKEYSEHQKALVAESEKIRQEIIHKPY